jgi:hypothetical protein
MAAQGDSSVERSIGRIEGQLDGIVATLKRVDERSAARDGTLESVLARLDAMETHTDTIRKVSTDFGALQQTLREGKIWAKGVLIGVGLVAGAGGATVATFFKGLYTWATGG